MKLHVNDLIERLYPYFEEGKMGLLCGAGISISSGIPDAFTIVKNLLEYLGCDTDDIDSFFSAKGDNRGDLPIAFEAIVGTLENNIEFADSQKDFLSLFAGNFDALPTQNHFFWASQLKVNKLHFIATTNFDTCLEQALDISPLSDSIIVSYPNSCDRLSCLEINKKIIKLHGSMISPSNIGTTIDQINNKHNIDNINLLVEKIFKKKDHSSVLIVGYSCSDGMDIIPKIQNLGRTLTEDEKVRIIYWQYKRNGEVFEWDLLKNVEDTPELIKVKNTCRDFEDTILVAGDLGLFIERFSGIKPVFHDGTFMLNAPIVNPSFVLGTLFSKAGLFDIGIKYYLKELEVINQSGGQQAEIKRAICYRHLGDAYGLNDEIDNSLKVLKKSVIIILRSNEKHNKELAESYYALSETYEDVGLIEKAIRTAHKAVKIYIDEYNDEFHPELAKIYSTLGEFYMKDEKPEIGLEYCKKSLKIRMEYYAERHPDVANTYTNMGTCYSAMGQKFYDNAYICHFKSLEIRKNVFGLYHERVAQAYNNVGHILYRKKEYSSALDYYKKVIAVYEKMSKGFNFYLVGATYENIGLVFYEQGQNAESLRYFFAAYEIYYNIFRDDTRNYNFARLFCSIANACISLGLCDKAEECLNSALLIAGNINLSKEHSIYGKIEQSFGHLRINKGTKF